MANSKRIGVPPERSAAGSSQTTQKVTEAVVARGAKSPAAQAARKK